MFIQQPGEFLRARRVLGQHQFQRGHRVGQPSGRVQTRSDAKPDVIGTHLVRHVRHIHQGPQPDLLRMRQSFQTRFYQNAVFACQRHDIGHRSDRHEVQMLAQVDALGKPPVTLQQCMGQLERNANTGQRR